MQTHEPKRAVRVSPGSAPHRGQLRVVCFSTYVSDRSRPSPQQDDVRRFLLALRGEKFEGVASVPVAGDVRSLSRTNSNDSIDWFGEMVVRYLEANAISAPLALVPVPTSRATLESSAGPWTALLAISIASNGLDDADIVDALRWRRPLPPPGQRSSTVAELYENLSLIQRLDRDVPVVLVDYLYTSSATLRACACLLREQGLRVPLALCAGRTTDREEHGGFTVVVGDIAPFEPGHCRVIDRSLNLTR
jgi:hypothetical protein